MDDKYLLAFTPKITIEGDEATLHLGDDDGTYSVELKADLGSTDFIYQPDDATYFTVYINQINNHFIYSYRYVADGTELTICEYQPAE